MLICGANDVIGVGQYGVPSCGYFPLLVLLRYRSGTGTAGTGLQVLVLLVLGVVGVHGCIISHMYTPHFMNLLQAYMSTSRETLLMANTDNESHCLKKGSVI